MTPSCRDILTEENIRSLITQIRKELGDVHKEQKDNLKGIEKRLAEVDQRQNRIILAYETGKMSLETYSERMDDLENMQQQLEQAKASANSTMDDRSTILENPDAVVAYAKELTEFLRLGGIGKAKPFLRRFVKHVWIEPGRGIIEYKIPLPNGSIHAGKTKREMALTEPVRSLVHPAQTDNCFLAGCAFRGEGQSPGRGESLGSGAAGGPAAIYHVHAAGAKAAFVTGEEEHQPGHFLGVAVASQRNTRRGSLLRPFDSNRRVIQRGNAHLLYGTHHPRLDRRGIDGIDPDSQGGALQGRSAHQADDGVFAGGVRRHISAATDAGRWRT